MTNEEAIKEIEQSGLYGNQVHQETLELAISALRAQQEREKGCEICNHPAKWLAIFGEQYPYLRARTQCYTDGKVTAVICPMCGRDLKPKEAQS